MLFFINSQHILNFNCGGISCFEQGPWISSVQFQTANVSSSTDAVTIRLWGLASEVVFIGS